MGVARARAKGKRFGRPSLPYKVHDANRSALLAGARVRLVRRSVWWQRCGRNWRAKAHCRSRDRDFARLKVFYPSRMGPKTPRTLGARRRANRCQDHKAKKATNTPRR
jgi:hypothetical protein